MCFICKSTIVKKKFIIIGNHVQTAHQVKPCINSDTYGNIDMKVIMIVKVVQHNVYNNYNCTHSGYY